MTNDDFQEYVIKKFNEWDVFINGNGKPGVKIRIDRLERCHNVMAKISMVMLVPLMTGIIFLIRYIVK